jgi:PAS domain S-box-containing protein
MAASHQESLRDLLRRVDEVRGLSESSQRTESAEPADPIALVHTVSELVDELERSHRRLIETNVQLVSLREVASRLVAAENNAEATRLVTRYLARAFGFEHAFLLLFDRESGRLEGSWTWGSGEQERSVPLALSVLEDRGAVTRSFWLDRTILVRDAQLHPAASLPDGHSLEEVLSQLSSLACVPLKRHSVIPAAEPYELCGGGCLLGDIAVLAPPPGEAAGSWHAEREIRQRQCLGCELMPVLGVIGMARSGSAAPLGAAETTVLESVALSVAPVVENARLFQELRKSERFRLHVLDSMASALIAVNTAGEILTFNRAAQTLLGFDETETLGHEFGALLGSDGEQLLKATLENGREVLREETMLRTRDGAAIPVSLSTSLLRDERRAVYGTIATFVDLRPLKAAEERARSLDRLAALGRFTSSVAHEIRNPLTGIAAGVQYLAPALGTDAPRRESLEFILGEIRRLDSIVQDLFDVTHPRQLLLRAAPLEATLRRALQSLEPLLAERHLRTVVEIAPHTPPVPHDADQIQQVFINLVKNAAEASPSGAALELSIGPGGRGLPGRDGPTVIARVRDQGPGIPPENLHTLFEPFFTTKPGGTGLGLYISHDIVERHAGALTVQSEDGCGATFCVELPLETNGGIS